MRALQERTSARSVLTPWFLLTLLVIAGSCAIFGIFLRSIGNHTAQLSLILSGLSVGVALLSVVAQRQSRKARAGREQA